MRVFCLLLALCCLLLSGCGKAPALATDALSDLLAAVAAAPPAHDVLSPAGTDAAPFADRLYGKDAAFFDCLADYAILLGRGTDLYEIHILRVKNIADRPRVVEALQTRADLLCLATEEGHTTVPAAIVCTAGTTVCLFATPYNTIFSAACKSL